METTRGLQGEIVPPADKSISHRAVMLAAIAKGKSIVRNFLAAEDPVSTMKAMKALGVEISSGKPGELVINGKGLYGLTEAADVIDCGNSGTTIRLLSGILSGNPFFSVLTGDDSLKQRPMARIINPLKEMGAGISGRGGDKYPPLAIKGGRLRPIDYALPMASAQVKSCMILAALYADGETSITEPFQSRDHTERMLGSMGADMEVEGLTVKVRGRGFRTQGGELAALDITVPADFSSAAFFIAAGLIVPDSGIMIRNVGTNPTRTGFLNVLKKMGAAVDLVNAREVSGEPVADISVRTAEGFKAVRIGKEIIPSIIDEFPILCVLATQADGVTEIRGAGELRVKESDRIKAMATELGKLGVELEEYTDGIAIKGRTALKGGTVESYGDHRVAMSLSIAGLIAESPIDVKGASCVDISFPGFFEGIEKLRNN